MFGANPPRLNASTRLNSALSVPVACLPKSSDESIATQNQPTPNLTSALFRILWHQEAAARILGVIQTYLLPPLGPASEELRFECEMWGGSEGCWLLRYCVLFFPFVGVKRDEWRDKWVMELWRKFPRVDGIGWEAQRGGTWGGTPDVEAAVRGRTAGPLSSQ